MALPGYEKSARYNDLDLIYAQCSGPGGLELAEFMARKMDLCPGGRLLDVGANRGYQTCFLVKEFGVRAVAIDPWEDRMDGRPMVEHVRENASRWGVEDKLLAIRLEVPETGFAARSFDYVYSTTALEMVRGMQGEERYLQSLREILRLLKPGGIFGLGEPMHLEVDLPPDLEPYVSQEEGAWKDFFRTVPQTEAEVISAGFQVLESGYAPEARRWWLDYAAHDPFCKQKPEEDPRALEVDGGRWVSFGYVIGRKPE